VEISAIEQAVNRFQAKHLSDDDEKMPTELLKLKEQIARHRSGLFRAPIRATTSVGAACGPDYVDRLKKAGVSVRVTHAEDFLDATDIERMAINEAAGEIYHCTIA